MRILQRIFNVKILILVILEYNRDINQCIFLLYNNTIEYKEFQDSLTSVHIDNNKIFQTITSELSEIIKTTQTWQHYFDQVNAVLIQKENSKKVFEHYEDKLIKLERQRARGDVNVSKLDRVKSLILEFKKVLLR